MQNQENLDADGKVESVISIQTPDYDSWDTFGDDEIMQQKSAIFVQEAEKVPFVGDKEPLSSLEAEYKSGSPILLEKIKVLSGQYAAIRRTRGDGNCFLRSFMFSYLEHILESQDTAEVDRIKINVENCRKTLRSLGYTEITFEDFFELFLEQLESALQGNENSIRFVTSGEIQKRSEFFEPFIMGLTHGTVDQFCKSAVEPMGEESDHVHIIALSDALGVPIRVLYLDRSSCDSGGISVNHHDFVPASSDGSGVSVGSEIKIPFITLLYRPGHYDILYPK
ncbi:ubiquitin thioesterase otubain-like isoform X2 [Cucurbita moschata]|uniref:Ubiquitin thioesterase n=1 Tax=Cucurbita moschata TaxID=3662 RepID=A0A6J1EX09_CUCMO|nr:ubiquitin thioesterase otubain-like isoform X2 [Cucurbita moschata]